MDGINKSMYDIASDSAFSILARTNELKSNGNEVINLCIGQPDFPTPETITRPVQVKIASVSGEKSSGK